MSKNDLQRKTLVSEFLFKLKVHFAIGVEDNDARARGSRGPRVGPGEGTHAKEREEYSSRVHGRGRLVGLRLSLSLLRPIVSRLRISLPATNRH